MGMVLTFVLLRYQSLRMQQYRLTAPSSRTMIAETPASFREDP